MSSEFLITSITTVVKLPQRRDPTTRSSPPSPSPQKERGRRLSKRDEYTRSLEAARALAAETLTLERTLSDLVNQACALTPAEIDLMWQTAPPDVPVPLPAT